MGIFLREQWVGSFIHPLASLLLHCSSSAGTINTISVGPTDVTAPFMTFPSTSIPSMSPATGRLWCVAGQPVAVAALQAAMDPVQPGASCFEPVTVHDHASYALNSYYQKDPVPASCDFGGSAVVTSTDPSYGSCQYPSTSPSLSVLNTSDSSGARVFGARPAVPSTSSVAPRSNNISCSRNGIFIAIFITLL